MKRTTSAAQPIDGEIWWRKISSGNLRVKIRGRSKILKQNERFLAKPEEIPLSFRRSVVPLEDLPTAPQETPPDNTLKVVEQKVDSQEKGYSIQKRAVGQWYDVIETVSGKALNEKALRLEQANDLLAALS